MSKVKIQGHSSGSGVLTIAAPNTNTDRTITLPDVTGTLLDSGSTLDATKLSGTLPAINGSALTNLPITGKLNLSGGAMTGAITTNSTFDGRDVAADGVLATNALPKAGGTMTGHTLHGDNINSKYGVDDDLQIYHNGSNSYINNTTGSLYIRDSAGDIYIQAKNNENSIVANNDGSVDIYYDNVKKFETTGNGVTISGGSSTGANLTVTSTAADDNIAPDLILYRNSASPADNDNLGGLEWKGNHSGGGINSYAQITCMAEDVTDGTEDASLRFYTATGGSTSEKMRINSAGNVGIGTASPDGKLHVHTATAGSVTASTDADDLVVENSGHAGISILSPDANRSALFFGHTADNLQLQIRHDGGTSLSQIISDDPIALWANGAERMRITSAGKVGIGRTSPSSKFHLYDGTAVDAFKVENYNRGAVWNSVGGGGMYSEYQLTGSAKFRMGQANHLVSGGSTGNFALQAASGDLLFSSGTTEKMRVTSSGLTFNGDTAAANALDDYEEGTWTPTFTFTGTAPNVTMGNINAGHYTKIGNTVHFHMVLHVNAYSSGSGNLVIGGLPFAHTATYTKRFITASLSADHLNWESDWTGVNLTNATGGTTAFTYTAMRDNAASEYIAQANYPTGNTYHFSTGHYYTDS